MCFGGCDLGWWFSVCSPFACILLVVCSLLVCCGFARHGSGFARHGSGFCLLWVWVLLGGDHGLLFQKLPPRHRHTSHLYHMTHTSQNFHHTTHTAHNLHNPPISTMPTLSCTPYRNPKRRSPLRQRPISTPQMPIFKQPKPKHQS